MSDFVSLRWSSLMPGNTFHNIGPIIKSKTGNINHFHVFVRGHFPLFATSRPREYIAETVNFSQLCL